MSRINGGGAYAHNGEVRIHYYDSGTPSESSERLPLIICPGLSETAEDYLDLLETLQPRRTIALSFRGRGRSDTPVNGYDLDEHVADLAAVIDEVGVDRYHLMGYSRGVAYALAYAQRNKQRVQSLILCDYPPEHRSMQEEWPEGYIHDYLIPYGRANLIRQDAVYGIQRNSTQQSLAGELDMPVLIAQGGLPDSLLSEEDIERYRQMCSRLMVRVYEEAGHGIKMTEKSALYRDISVFAAAND